MRSKKGVAPLVIGGISVGAIIYFIFQLWATGLVIDALGESLEPELERVLNQLNEKIICLPEASSENHEICINNLGNVLVNGDLPHSIEISTDSGDFCNIDQGKYDYNIVCTLSNINKAKQIYIEGLEDQKKVIAATQIAGYATNLQNLKKPIKSGFLFFKKTRYIPI